MSNQPEITLLYRILAEVLNMRLEAYLNRMEVKKMSEQLDKLKAQITKLQEAVDADVAQDVAVVTAVNALLEKLKNVELPEDITEQITALADATAKLSSDNAAVQTALDAAGTV